MPIDKAELATEIEKNPEIEKIATETLAKKGFVIRDKATDTTFMDNYKRDVLEKELPKEIDKATAQIHNRYDQDIETALGVKKDANEKSYDYLKRAASGKLAELNIKIEGYEKTIREKGDPTGVLQKKIEAAEEKARLAIEERDAKIKTLTTDNEKATKGILLQQDYSELSKSFVKTLPAMFAISSKYILDGVLANAVMKEGKLYVGDGTGGIKKDSAFKEILVSDDLKLQFKDVIDVKREQGGAGSGKGGGNQQEQDPSQFTVDNFNMPSISTQLEVTEALIKAGVPKGSVAFKEIFQKYAMGITHEVVAGKRIQKQTGKELPLGQ